MKPASLAGHIIELAIQASIRPFNQAAGNEKSVDPRDAVPPADRIVAEFFRSRRYLGSHDRRFISQTFYGIIRFRRRLNVLLQQFFADHPALAPPVSQGASQFLQLLVYMTAVEEYDPQEVIGSLHERWRKDIPGIELPHVAYWMVQHKSLGFLRGGDIEQLANWYSFEEWMVQEWVEQFGLEEAEDLLHALNSEAPVTLRVNTLRTTVEECQSRLLEEGVETSRARYSPGGLVASKRFNTQASRAFQQGMYELQDEGSQIIGHLAQPRREDFVIDACAGAGGKTLMLAELMHDGGEIVALDAEPKRLKELEKRAARAGVRSIVTRGTRHLHPGDLLGKADLVLVDAPCTGVGTIRRNPAFKWSVTPGLVEDYARKQLDILDANASYVRHGGRLVYATCSLLRKENEDVVSEFFTRHTDFQTTAPESVLDRLGLSGTLFSTPEKEVNRSTFIKLLPHRQNTNGFFVALFERKT